MTTRTVASTRAAYWAFATFGALWGVWGAALPAVRDAAEVDEGGLGLALLFIGVGALPAMAVAGRAVDRFGGRAVAAALGALAAAGVGVAVLATGPVLLVGGMLVLGATSGAADVGANAVAAAAERATGRSVLTRSHGVFSAAVVVASLVTGGVQLAGWPVAVAFAAVLPLAAAAAVPLRSVPPAPTGPPSPAGAVRRSRLVPLATVGAVGALAFAVENAHQSWGAVFLADELAVASGSTAVAPAVFAGVAAAIRFLVGAVPPLPPGPLLVGGAAAAAVGSGTLAAASSAPVALAGLALAAAGSAVLFPTLLREALTGVPDHERGRATSVVSATAYAGFVLGPVLVGGVARTADLRTAFAVVAAAAVLTAVLARPVTQWAARAR